MAKVHHKTDIIGIIVIVVLVILEIGTLLYYFLTKKDLKDCEANTSFSCPVFSCAIEEVCQADITGSEDGYFAVNNDDSSTFLDPENHSQTLSNPLLNCGKRPFRYQLNADGKTYKKICMPYPLVDKNILATKGDNSDNNEVYCATG